MAFVGIDLGTTTSEVAIYENDRPRIIRDGKGEEIIDSYVGFDKKTRNLEVGEKVWSIFKDTPENGIEQVKRRMGEDVQIPVGDQELRPEEVSAHILTYLKKAAEDDLNEEVDRAVITVPANFPDNARRATQQAGEIAGMSVRRIINEPTAAALAYGVGEEMEDELVMVYDLGGGTFDVTLVEYVGQALDVKASAGDPHLGGKDFDEALLNYVAERFTDEHGVKVEKDTGAYYRLLEACEEAKKELSYSHATSVNIPFFAVKDGQQVNLDVEMTRAKFEELVGPMIDRTEKAIGKTLKDAGASTNDLSRVILVGGSTRIPYARRLVERVTGKKPLSSIDPDRAVALGAAAQTAIIDGKSDQIIMDVVPFSLGTATVANKGGMAMPGVYSPIIETNAPMQKPFSEAYATMHDEQEAVDFRIYQRGTMSETDHAEVDGQPNEDDDYTLLDRRTVEMPPGPAGQKLEVTYTYNLDGMIDVELTVPLTGETVRFQTSSGLDEAQIEASRAEVEGAWKESDYYEDVQALLHAAEKEMNKGMDPDEEKQLNVLLRRMRQALATNDKAKVKEVEDDITDLLFDIRL